MTTPITIVATTKKRLSQNRIQGSIHVRYEGRDYKVQFDRDRTGNWSQWGAPTDVLCRTVETVESLVF